MNPNDIIILNPDYQFKNDKDRIVMYSNNNVNQYSSSKWVSFIHPWQAIVLSLFTTRRYLKEQICFLSERFQLETDKVKNIIYPFINNEFPISTEFSSERIYFPKNVLINSDRVLDKTFNYDFDISEFKCDEVNLSQDRMHRAPHILLFMITNECVTECKYCCADKAHTYEELTTNEIFEIIEEAKRLKILNIELAGGEVFCKKDWDIILKKLVDTDLSPNYISVKFPVTKKIAQLLDNTGYRNEVQISLDSMEDDTLSKIIGTKKGYVNKVKAGIGYLQEHHFKILVNTVLTKHNSTIEELEKIHEYVSTIQNFVYWEIRVPMASIYAPKSFTDVKSDRDTLLKIYDYVRSVIIPKSNITILTTDDALGEEFYKGKCSDPYFGGGHCSVLERSLYILPDGKVTPCEQLYWHPQFILGDLKKQTIEEVWHSEKAKSMFLWKKEFYDKESYCLQCKAFDFCHENHRKCWTSVIRAYGYENWNYPDPRCEYAPKIKTDMLYL